VAGVGGWAGRNGVAAQLMERQESLVPVLQPAAYLFRVGNLQCGMPWGLGRFPCVGEGVVWGRWRGKAGVGQGEWGGVDEGMAVVRQEYKPGMA